MYINANQRINICKIQIKDILNYYSEKRKNRQTQDFSNTPVTHKTMNLKVLFRTELRKYKRK